MKLTVWPVHTRSAVAYFAMFAAAFVLTAVAVSYGQMHEAALRRDIVQSNEMSANTLALFSLVQDAETGQRGYLLTQDRRLLRPYDGALRRIRSERDRLSLAVDGDAAERASFVRLDAAVGQKLAELAETVALNDQKGPKAARAQVLSGRGVAYMDTIRNEIREITRLEDARLAARHRASSRFRLVRNIAVLGSILVIAGIMGLFLWRDDRRQAAQAALLIQLRETAARQKIIFDSAVDAIVTLNPSGSIETINAAGLRLFGYTEEELLRRDVSLLLDLGHEARAVFLTRLQGPDDLSTGFVRALKARTKSGVEVPVDVALSAMTLSDGVHVVAIVRDASQRREVEALKDSFIATVSHELRTPLTSIAGSLGLLRGGAGGALPARAMRLVEIAEANGARLVRLINDILDIEKMQSGTALFDLKPLQLRDVARTACDAMSGLAFERSVDLGVDPIDPELWVLGDHDRMMQVLGNLLSNAIKVSPHGGKVRLSAEAKGARVLLKITDEGPGVPLEFRSRIFTPFAQANETDRRSGGGTGLGLSIVREIVERHSGVVGLESEPGHGAVFYLDLPLIHAPVGQDPTEPERAIPSILICEDDELIAEVLNGQLESFGYESDIVTTANAARHALHIGSYDAMLLDIRLPDSDGVTLMQALRASPNTAALPIIAMSGSAEHKARAEEQGIIDWLEKPIRMERLERALKAALESRHVTAPLILHVDDDRDLAEVARARLGGLGEIVSVTSLAAARAVLMLRRPDLVVLDLGLPDGAGDSLLGDLAALPGGAPPTIIYTAQELSTPPPAPVRAVLVKSRSDLRSLARLARKLIEEKRG